MTVYERGHPGDEAEILDLANYAFSRHRFHDFRSLLPKVYGIDKHFTDMHIVARNNGKICGLVATLQQEMRIDGQTNLNTGYVGTVCVHPYSQGEGHMTALMKLTAENAQRLGLDMLVLGGQRQRYQYAGFECGGTRIVFNVTGQNISHALSDEDTDSVRLMEVSQGDSHALDACHGFYSVQMMIGPRPRNQFHDIMRSWNGKLFLITRDNIPAGYLYACGPNIEELALEEEAMLGKVIKCWHKQCGAADFHVTAPAHTPGRITGLRAFAESYQVTDAEMIRIFRWPQVIEKLLTLKSLYMKLDNGRMVIEITDACRLLV